MFTTEEILEEFAEAGGAPVRFMGEGFIVRSTERDEVSRYAALKADPARLEKHRQTARESAAKRYREKTLEERTAPMRRYLEKLRADPVRWAAHLERRKQSRKAKR